MKIKKLIKKLLKYIFDKIPKDNPECIVKNSFEMVQRLMQMKNISGLTAYDFEDL